MSADPSPVPGLAAADHYREWAEGSGVPDDGIRQAGVISTLGGQDLLELGFADWQAALGRGWVVPLHDVNGRNSRWVFKPDRPRPRRDNDGQPIPGKVVKYEFPADAKPILDVPQTTTALLRNPLVPLFFTEGAKKAHLLASLGVPVIDLWGVHNWYTNPEHDGRFESIVGLPDWATLRPYLRNRLCVLLFDSDASEKWSVRLARNRLDSWLTRQASTEQEMRDSGAIVIVPNIPPGPNGEKQGIDDFLAPLPPEDRAATLQGLVAEAMRSQRLDSAHFSTQAQARANPEVKPGDKLVVEHLITDVAWRQSAGDPGPYTMPCRETIGAAVGRPPGAVTRAYKLGNGYLWDTEVTRVPLFDEETGEPLMYTTKTGKVLQRYDSTVMLRPRFNGVEEGDRLYRDFTPDYRRVERKRQHCPECHEDLLIEQHRTICTGCGVIVRDWATSERVEADSEAEIQKSGFLLSGFDDVGKDGGDAPATSIRDGFEISGFPPTPNGHGHGHGPPDDGWRCPTPDACIRDHPEGQVWCAANCRDGATLRAGQPEPAAGQSPPAAVVTPTTARQSDTRIRWTNTTWNPMVGCSQVSPGCAHCYAKRIFESPRARARYPHGFTPTFKPEKLGDPARWRTPRRVFVNSMSDMFHEAFNDEQIGQVFEAMAAVPRHTYQVLTKRPERMRDFVQRWVAEHGPLGPNVWLGTSIENNRHTYRADVLREVPAAVRFISAEPLLGPLPDLDLDGIHWLIVGGESGPRHRPMDMAWCWALYQQSRRDGVAFFFKQDAGHRTEERPWLVTPDGDRLVVEEYPEPGAGLPMAAPSPTQQRLEDLSER